MGADGTRRVIGRLIGGGVAVAAALGFGPAGAVGRDATWMEQCVQMTAGGKSVPDVNSQVGDQRLTVGIDRDGTITNLRYPSPSFYNQVKYFGTGIDANGNPVGVWPNEGVFPGLELTLSTSTGPHTTVVWLKQPDLRATGSGWTVTQRYLDPGAPIVRTTYHSDPLGVTVQMTDVATPEPLDDPSVPPSLVRSFTVTRAVGSPVATASLIGYAHLGVYGSRLRYAPVEDTCMQEINNGDLAIYRPSADAITQSWTGVDKASGKPSRIAFAMGFQRQSSAHQVGEDHTDPLALPPGDGPADGFDELSSSTPALTGNGVATGPVTTTMIEPLRFDSAGSATTRWILSAAHTGRQALAALAAERTRPEATLEGAIRRVWRARVDHAPLPAVDSAVPEQARVLEVARRALMAMQLAYDPDSGAIVAAAFNQSAYGQDWIRDGAFINEAFDQAGFTAQATRHALFEASVQTTVRNPDVLRAPGNWPMNTYGDGIPGGPIPYEIDETGLGAWMLYRQSLFLDPASAQTYLTTVFPAIARAADYLTACADPRTGLTCPSPEDDNSGLDQTLHGSAPSLLGLRSAVAAAQALGKGSDPRVALWQSRATQLQNAIDALWQPAAGVFGEGYQQSDVAGQASLPTVGSVIVPSGHSLFEDGGWLIWPVALHPYGDPRMASEIRAVLAATVSDLQNASGGEYESKGLLAACRALPSLPPGEQATDRAEIQRAVEMIAADSTANKRGLTTDTGLLSESWITVGTGASAHLAPRNETPHTWAESMFYLISLCAFGHT